MHKWRTGNTEYKWAYSISVVCRNCQDIDNSDNCEWKHFLWIQLELMLGRGCNCNQEAKSVSD